MSDYIAVQFSQLQASAEALQSHAGTLDGHIQDLLTALGQMESTWMASGSSAAESAQQVKAQLVQAIQEIINTINQFGVKVTEAHDHQLSVENSNAAMFG
jgi:uncharacterized protein YukE